MTSRGGRTFRALRHRNFRLFFTGQGVSMVGHLAAAGRHRLARLPADRLGAAARRHRVLRECRHPVPRLVRRRDRRPRRSPPDDVRHAGRDGRCRRCCSRPSPRSGVVAALAPRSCSRCGWASSNAFDIPLRQSIYVQFVDDRNDLPNAIALNSFLVNAARVVGPAVAGVLLAVTTRGGVLRAQRAVLRRGLRRAGAHALPAAPGARRRARPARELDGRLPVRGATSRRRGRCWASPPPCRSRSCPTRR